MVHLLYPQNMGLTLIWVLKSEVQMGSNIWNRFLEFYHGTLVSLKLWLGNCSERTDLVELFLWNMLVDSQCAKYKLKSDATIK